jgi:RNA polymerase sigma factor (sigma-70 family)
MSSIENDIYNQVEKMVSPIIHSNAKKFCRTLSMTIEEAKQEARIALMLALRKYDYNDSRGGIYNFASISVRRHFLKMVSASQAQKRKPHIRVKGCDKLEISFFHNTPLPRDECIQSDMPNPEEQGIISDSKRVAGILEESLMEALEEREKNVFRCKINPPRELRMLMVEECEETPTIPTIGKHLSLSKNSVDWSIRKIRETAETIIRRKFSYLSDYDVVKEYMEKDL